MKDSKLSRRKILSAMVAAGGSGAFVGHSTVSFFSDEETFTNNSITGSKAAAGTVALDIDPKSLSLSQENDSVELTASVPDTEGQRENPAFVCVQTNRCPYEGINPDDLRVALELGDCTGASKRLLVGSLREILDALQEGILLPCNREESRVCLQPGGESVKLTIKVLQVRDEDGDFVGFSQTNREFKSKFALDFLAEQCRANEPTVPSEPGLFDLFGTCPTDEECPPTGDKDISFIAFCCKDGGDPNPEIKTHRPGNDGFTSIIWETQKYVDYVVVFGGNYWTIYDYSDYRFKETPSGIATTGGDTAANFYGPTSSLDDNGFNGCQNGNAQSCPCQVAEDIVGTGDTFTGTSVKFEYCEGENDDELKFRPEDECKNKNGNGGG